MNLNDSEKELAALSCKHTQDVTQKAVATHMLQFMVKGITSSATFLYSYFPTNGLTATQLYSIVRETVENLKLQNIRILAIVCDGHNVNRSFMKLASPKRTIHTT